MKKLALIFLLTFGIAMLLGSILPKQFSYAEQTSCVKVITNYANVYEDHSTSSKVLFVATHKDKFSVASEVPLTFGNESFYQIFYGENSTGYVLANQVVLNPNTNISNLITPNAHFKKKVTSAEFYVYSNAKYELFCTMEVSPKTPIRIIDGYNKNKEFTLVQVLIEDEIANLYIQTDTIRPMGIPIWLKVVLYVLSSLAVGALITFVTLHAKKISKKLVN